MIRGSHENIVVYSYTSRASGGTHRHTCHTYNVFIARGGGGSMIIRYTATSTPRLSRGSPAEAHIHTCSSTVKSAVVFFFFFLLIGLLPLQCLCDVRNEARYHSQCGHFLGAAGDFTSCCIHSTGHKRQYLVAHAFTISLPQRVYSGSYSSMHASQRL